MRRIGTAAAVGALGAGLVIGALPVGPAVAAPVVADAAAATALSTRSAVTTSTVAQVAKRKVQRHKVHLVLVKGPRGKDDYIEIAGDYPAVLLSNVPVFDETRDNAARRFISLIDELYDRGVNLAVSAAAPPDRLYQGTRLAFEFQRASSRLVEMQTEQYLARAHG